MKRSLEKATAVAAGAVLLAAGNTEAVHIPSPETVASGEHLTYPAFEPTFDLVAAADQLRDVKYKDTAFRPGYPVEVDVYKLKTSEDEQDYLNDEQIRRAFGSAATYLSYDSYDQFDMEIDGIGVLVLKPSGVQPESNAACFTRSDISNAAHAVGVKYGDFSHDRLVHIISNRTDACRDDAEGSDAIGPRVTAFAVGNMNYYSLMANGGDKPVSYYDPNTILHETGHNLGLKHFPKIVCEYDASTANNPMLRDISEILKDKSCGPARNSSGEINYYAESSSVMGNNDLSSEDFDDPFIPALSNVDRISVLSDQYPAKKIDTRPASYRLGYGPRAINALEIELSADHPLRALDEELTKIIISNEIDGEMGRMGREPYKDERACGKNALCDVIIVASNETYTKRFAIDDTRYLIEAADGKQAQHVIYLDESMDFGVVWQGDKQGDPIVHIVDYTTGEKLAEVQQKAHQDYINRINSKN